jgi:hypothetical protein
MKALLKKEHKITAGSQGQTCFIWSKNVRDLALSGRVIDAAKVTGQTKSRGKRTITLR